MKKIISFLFFILSPVFLISSNLKLNSIFPNIPLNAEYLSKIEKEYLGIPKNCKRFKLSEIKSEYIVLEFINVYCYACQKQAPDFNKFYEKLKNRKNIKFLSIALGNCENEILSFKKRFNILFPIIPDEKFSVYEKIGGTRTPFTLILKDTKIVYGHLGLISNYTELYSVLLDKKSYMKIVKKENFIPEKISDELVIEKIKPKFKKILKMKKFKNYYRILADGKTYYVVPISSSSVCNICHPVQFIYIVTEDGKIFDFIPIHLTKRFNKKWTSQEVDKMRSRLLGKNVLKDITFNKNVDAVTSATITSSMIFHFINQAKEILPIFK